MAITYSTLGYTPSHGGGAILTPILAGTGVPDIEKAAESLAASVADYKALQRELDAARDNVQRIPEYNRTAARDAGARGEAVDHNALAHRRVALIEREAWLDLDVEAFSTRLGQERESYLATIRESRDQLVKNARKQHEAATVKLNTARQMIADAASTLTGTVLALGAAPMIASGQLNIDLRAVGPRTGGDDISDGGHPATWAGSAEEPLLRAIGWAGRWANYSKDVLEPQWRGEQTPESVAKAAAEQAAAEAAARFAVE